MSTTTDTPELGVIARLVADQEGGTPPALTTGTTLEQDLGLNSAKVVDLLGRIEEHFDCVVEDEDLETLGSVGDLVAVVRRRAAG